MLRDGPFYKRALHQDEYPTIISESSHLFDHQVHHAHITSIRRQTVQSRNEGIRATRLKAEFSMPLGEVRAVPREHESRRVIRLQDLRWILLLGVKLRKYRDGNQNRDTLHLAHSK